LKIKLVAITAITPYDRNPRNHDVEAIARSISEFGWQQPIVVDASYVIVAGHGRFFAAQQLGLSRVPIKVASDLSEDQIRAYRLADNKTNELASWNLELLASELEALKELDYDLGILGFGPDELAKIMDTGTTEGLVDPDDIPEPPDEAITKPSEIWILGNHRLMCGDSSSATDLDKLLAGQVIHLVNTDPPYNVNVEPRSNNAIASGKNSKGFHHQGFDSARNGNKKPTNKKLRPKDRPLANDFVSEAEFDRLLEAWFANIERVLEPGRSFYIWGGYANCANYPPVLKSCNLKFAQAVIWHKMHPVLTRKDFMGDHEWCFYGWREGAAHIFLGPNNVPDVWQVKKVNHQAMVHLTEKPVELAVRAMQYSSRPGENVLDLFGGSGSTLIAAEQTGRKAHLMEIDPLYCDVIVQRWENFTGKKATRIGQVTKVRAKKSPSAKKTIAKKKVVKKKLAQRQG
jgi:DNA modification methylase